jgi:hypothetical protein
LARKVHYCGSLPPELTTHDQDVMRWYLDHGAGHELTALPSTQDPAWVVRYLRGLAHHTDVFEVTAPGDYEDYSDMRGYRVRRGAALRPEHVSHGDIATALSQIQAFEELRDRTAELANVPLLLSVPCPIDLALFAFVGPTFDRAVPAWSQTREALRHMPVFVDAAVNYVRGVTQRYAALHNGAAVPVMWQVETPSAVIGMWKARIVPVLGPWFAAKWHARIMARMLASFPPGANVLLHECFGDYNHTSVFAPKNLAWPVNYLNHLRGALARLGVAMPVAFIPAAYGAQPPPTNAEFYAPLSQLHPAWTSVVGGVVCADNEEDSAAALHLFEHAMGRSAIAVSCACGLGRHTVEAAERATQVMAKVAALPVAA